MLLASTHDGNTLMAAVVTGDLLEAGTEARHILAGAAKAIGGRAGGRARNAGGRESAALADAVAIAATQARAHLAGLR